MLALQQELILEENECPVYKKYLPKISPLEAGAVNVNLWDIPFTISELSYLVHSHYRYYGKFPSVVAGQLLEDYPPPSSEHYVLDNFCGSGTTLVEAKIRGIRSYGVDISWLSCLASNVKSNDIDLMSVKSELQKVIQKFNGRVLGARAPEDSFVAKWFNQEAARDLFVLQQIILELSSSKTRDFLLVAYLGIVRRVSKAFDGEVRPHVNKDKKQRNVLDAFSKKVMDMCSDHHDFMALLTSKSVTAKCMVGDNRRLPDHFDDGKCYLAISHPPYLNSFNYTPVYSLEFYWGAPFEPSYTGGGKNLHKQELTAHPANERITESYFEHLKCCYQETYRIQREGSYLAVVIGDCTRDGKLVPVLDRTIQIVESIGYKSHEYNYRTTHYGLGKYAYKHRADYHGQADKKDGILIFRK